jgi:hypothetical protein
MPRRNGNAHKGKDKGKPKPKPMGTLPDHRRPKP